ncbi:undecaprenyl-diphosphate phosphatase [Priestia filamentosa]|uniref:undecaprenyl-diphosphate phosphatase n=1 Tax=Priestia filamentosa TaxID=1402861 RepID=UPI0005894D18
MSDIIHALILGIIEGLTEFLPISSTGHLILAGHLLNFTGDKAKTFEVVIQLGSILAISILYRKKLLSLLNFNFKKNTGKLNIIHIALGIIPAGIVGLLTHDFIKEYLFSPKVVVYSLIAGAILMIFAEKKKVNVTAHSLDEVTYKQALSIGLFQCLAVCPGFSRAGSTISGGLLSGVNHKASAEFSFLIALPIMIAASGLDLLDSAKFLTMSDLPLFATGFITAFVVAMIGVVTFLKILEKVKLTPFAIYRIILAILFMWIVL